MLKHKRPARNLELRLAYNGRGFFGWQIQPGRRTVQGLLQKCLAKILGESVKTTGASRTDTGVHAHDQHVNFETRNPIPASHLHRALEHLLPADVQALSVHERETGFSARHDARAKHYTYFWLTSPSLSPYVADSVWRENRSLDGSAMHHATTCLVGTRNFKALQSSRDHRRGSTTTLMQATVSQAGNLVCCDIIGHRFLYHMVRNIAGALAKVGRGEWTPAEFETRLASGDRRAMALTAPAQGLHLFQVYYNEPPFSITPERTRFAKHLKLFA